MPIFEYITLFIVLSKFYSCNAVNITFLSGLRTASIFQPLPYFMDPSSIQTNNFIDLESIHSWTSKIKFYSSHTFSIVVL